MAELAAERALADQLADAIAGYDPDNETLGFTTCEWCGFLGKRCPMHVALAAHRAARTPQEKP